MMCPLLRQNVGSIDRLIRMTAGVIALLVGTTMPSGAVQTIIQVVGIVALATGAFGYCGLYSLLGISTLQKKK